MDKLTIYGKFLIIPIKYILLNCQNTKNPRKCLKKITKILKIRKKLINIKSVKNEVKFKQYVKSS